MSYLIMRRGPKPGEIYRLTDAEMTIGRGTKNQIIIFDNDVSREHARLRRTDVGYEIEDLDSTNGTFVNGQPVDGVWLLQSRCIVELGEMITLEYMVGDPTATEETEGAQEFAPTPSSPHYLMVTVNSQGAPSIYPLNDAEITVGRGVTNDIVIVEPEMSREHFQLSLAGKGYKIKDLGSTNGTMVNGELLEDEQILHPDDLIQIGTMVQMRYSTSADNFITNMPTTVFAESPDTSVFDTDPALRKKTTPSQMPEILRREPLKTTTFGTGLENVNLRKRILISYARTDWENTVAPLFHALQERSIDAWVDQYLNEGGDDWRAATEQARLECWLLVVVVSESAMKSNLVRRNWRHFHNREKPIILLMRDLVENLPIGSDKLTQVDFNPALPNLAYTQMVTEIERLRTKYQT